MSSDSKAGSDLPQADHSSAQIADQLRQRFGQQVVQAEMDETGALQVQVEPAAIVEVCQYLSGECDQPYPYLSDAFGADYEDHLQIVYHLFRAESGEEAFVRVDLPREDASVPTLTGVYETANWPEREIAEMFGITFVGHPDPRKLLLPEDWTGHPLRKDYQPPDHPYRAPEPLHENPPAALQRAAEATESGE